MDSTEEHQSAVELALASVTAALDKYDATSAEITVEEHDGGPVIRVTPHNPEAAAIAMRVGADGTLLFTFGRTSLALAGDDPERFDHLRTTLQLIFQADFIEVGPGHGQSQFELPDGAHLRVGEHKSPLQRRFGPKHRYQPYRVQD